MEKVVPAQRGTFVTKINSVAETVPDVLLSNRVDVSWILKMRGSGVENWIWSRNIIDWSLLDFSGEKNEVLERISMFLPAYKEVFGPFTGFMRRYLW